MAKAFRVWIWEAKNVAFPTNYGYPPFWGQINKLSPEARVEVDQLIGTYWNDTTYMNIRIPMEFSVWMPKMWEVLLLSLTPRVSCASKVDTFHGFRTQVQWDLEQILWIWIHHACQIVRIEGKWWCCPCSRHRKEPLNGSVEVYVILGSMIWSYRNRMKQQERWLSAGEVEEVVGRDQQWTFGRGLGSESSLRFSSIHAGFAGNFLWMQLVISVSDLKDLKLDTFIFQFWSILACCVPSKSSHSCYSYVRNL